MIVINSKAAYSLYCKRMLVISPLLPDYIKAFKASKKMRLAKGEKFEPDQFAINYYETFLLPPKLSVDWILKDSYHGYN